MKSGTAIAGFLLVFILFFSFSNLVESAPQSVPASLSDQSDQIVQYADANQIQAAKNVLGDLEMTWSKVKTDYSETARRTIDIQLNQLGSDLAGSSAAGVSQAHALSLRLSLDVLASANHDPLWIQMEDPVLSTVGAMASAIRKNDIDTFYYQRSRFLNQYATIYPSLVISGSGDLLARVDRLVSGIGGEHLTAKEDLAVLAELQSALRQLFHPEVSLPAERIQPVAFVVGAVLILCLLFVSWRKFRGGSSHWLRTTYK